MKIKAFMSKRIISLDLDRTLLDVKHLFDRTRFHHLLITQHERLVGIVSDRDYLKAMNPRIDTVNETQADREVLKRHVNVIMSHKVISLSGEHDFFDAVTLFNEHKISCIPIVDDDHRIQGLVSWRDLMRVLLERQSSQQKNENPH